MKNVQATIEGKTLVIRVDLTQNHGKSKSGKTQIVASTGGNVSVPGAPDGFKLGLNAYLDV
jgi:hypothetical protein